MRSAEMYLIEAEGYAHSGQTQQAIEALNALRNARKAVLFSGGGQEELVQAILIERRKELWGEGFSLSDFCKKLPLSFHDAPDAGCACGDNNGSILCDRQSQGFEKLFSTVVIARR